MITVGKSAQLGATIATRQAEVDGLLADKMAAPWTYQDHGYQIDLASQSRMQAIFIKILAGIPSPSGGFWRTVDNVNVDFSDDDLKTFLLGAAAYVQSLLDHSFAAKDALKALTTLTAVAAYDTAAGWPG